EREEPVVRDAAEPDGDEQDLERAGLVCGGRPRSPCVPGAADAAGGRETDGGKQRPEGTRDQKKEATLPAERREQGAGWGRTPPHGRPGGGAPPVRRGRPPVWKSVRPLARSSPPAWRASFIASGWNTAMPRPANPTRARRRA